MKEIKQLRRKFVLINMAIVSAMMLAIGVFFLTTVTNDLRSNSMELLERVISQDELGLWPGGSHQKENNSVSLPYFTVTVLRNGNALVSSSQFYHLEESAVTEVVDACFQQSAASGVLEEYGLRYLRQSTVLGWKLAFADMTQERSTIKTVLQGFAVIFLLGFAAFFFISIQLSRWAVRPVEQSIRQQRQFVADASHELKTPLTVILSNTEMLQRYGVHLEEKDRRRLDNIQASSAQMRELVEELLTLARSDNSAGKALTHSRLNLSELAEDTVLSFDAVVFESGHSLESRISPDLHVSGDSGKLRRLLEILLDNACKYASPGGSILVTLAPEGTKKVRLTVSNQGDPIPREQLERIFERFYRADQARTSEGFGLGLPIARAIAEEHRGKIWAESDVGENRFHIVLPLEK